MAPNDLAAKPDPIRIAFQLSGVLAAPSLIKIPMNSDGLINRARSVADCLARMYRSSQIGCVPSYESDFVCFDIMATDGTHVEEVDFRRFVLWISRMTGEWAQTQDTIQWHDNPAKELAQSISHIRECGRLSIRIGSSPHLIHMNSAPRRVGDDGDTINFELSRAIQLREIDTPSERVLATTKFATAMSKGDQISKNVLTTAKQVRRTRAVLIGIREQNDGSQDLFSASDEAMDNLDD